MFNYWENEYLALLSGFDIDLTRFLRSISACSSRLPVFLYVLPPISIIFFFSHLLSDWQILSANDNWSLLILFVRANLKTIICVSTVAENYKDDVTVRLCSKRSAKVRLRGTFLDELLTTNTEISLFYFYVHCSWLKIKNV